MTQCRKETVFCGNESASSDNGYIQCRDVISYHREVRVHCRDMQRLENAFRNLDGHRHRAPPYRLTQCSRVGGTTPGLERQERQGDTLPPSLPINCSTSRGRASLP